MVRTMGLLNWLKNKSNKESLDTELQQALSLTKAGINLPSIYVSYILNEKPFYFSYTHFKEVTFVNDKAAFEYYLMGGFTKSEYKDLLRKVSIQLIDNKDDRLAQLSFNLLRYKTLLFSLIK